MLVLTGRFAQDTMHGPAFVQDTQGIHAAPIVEQVRYCPSCQNYVVELVGMLRQDDGTWTRKKRRAPRRLRAAGHALSARPKGPFNMPAQYARASAVHEQVNPSAAARRPREHQR